MITEEAASGCHNPRQTSTGVSGTVPEASPSVRLATTFSIRAAIPGGVSEFDLQKAGSRQVACELHRHGGLFPDVHRRRQRRQ